MAANHRERIVLEHNRLDQKILSELKHEDAPMHPTLDALFANGHAALKWFDGEPTYVADDKDLATKAPIGNAWSRIACPAGGS